MTRSTVKPSEIWLKSIEPKGEGLQVTFGVAWNIRTIKIDNIGETHIEFEYDEQEIEWELPNEINSKKILKSYLEENKQNIIQTAQAKVILSWCSQIEEIREFLKNDGGI